MAHPTEGEGTEVTEFFAVLRHMIFGENRGLEWLRRVVAQRSLTKRVDIPIPYEPDVEILAFEEADVWKRSQALCAASWLMDGWPDRFSECCREAEVEYSALNRNSIRVKWYQRVAAMLR